MVDETRDQDFVPSAGVRYSDLRRTISASHLWLLLENGLVISLGSPRNVLGGVLEDCSLDPMTGFYRDGCCKTGPNDIGRHLVCSRMTAAFLAFSKSRGNDLSTPMPQYQFPGLKPGDQWCLCAERWREAFEAGMAPRVVLKATHEKALEFVPLAALVEFAVDPPEAT